MATIKYKIHKPCAACAAGSAGVWIGFLIVPRYLVALSSRIPPLLLLPIATSMDDVVFFYGGFEPLARIAVVGTLAYFSLVILLRIAGKRTLAQLNAFDFVITIAIGSTLGRLITAKGVSLAESVMAFFMLIFLQYVVSWLTTRFSAFEDLVTADPSLLYFRGHFLRKAMQAQRVTQAELLAAVRENRIASLQDVEAIVMESAGTIAVIKKGTVGEHENFSTLSNVPGITQ